MAALIQLGFLAGRQTWMLWAEVVLAMFFSVAAGALFDRFFMHVRDSRPDRESTVDELAMLRTVMATLPDPLYVKDSESRFLLANEGTARNCGAASVADLLGKTDFDFFPREIAAGFFEDERKILLSGQPQISKEEFINERNGAARYVSSTKVPLFDALGRTVGIVGVGRNITALKMVEAELRRTQEELKFKATHDSLTSLLNRGAIMEMLERELARGARENSNTAVLLGDLDHFKEVNDTHGHPVGDEILRQVADRLVGTVRSYDLVGRYGGEEFLVVLPGCAEPDALTRADQLREAVAAPQIPTSHGSISITISVGVIVAGAWGQPTTATILREVDNAMYAAKAAGRNRHRLAVPFAPILH